MAAARFVPHRSAGALEALPVPPLRRVATYPRLEPSGESLRGLLQRGIGVAFARDRDRRIEGHAQGAGVVAHGEHRQERRAGEARESGRADRQLERSAQQFDDGEPLALPGARGDRHDAVALEHAPRRERRRHRFGAVDDDAPGEVRELGAHADPVDGRDAEPRLREAG